MDFCPQKAKTGIHTSFFFLFSLLQICLQNLVQKVFLIVSPLNVPAALYLRSKIFGKTHGFHCRPGNTRESERGSGESIEMNNRKVRIDPNGNAAKGYAMIISVQRLHHSDSVSMRWWLRSLCREDPGGESSPDGGLSEDEPREGGAGDTVSVQKLPPVEIFDSTALFHWCRPRPFNTVILVSILNLPRHHSEEQTFFSFERMRIFSFFQSHRTNREVLKRLKNHVIVCIFAERKSPQMGLCNFLMPLRASSLRYCIPTVCQFILALSMRTDWCSAQLLRHCSSQVEWTEADRPRGQWGLPERRVGHAVQFSRNLRKTSKLVTPHTVEDTVNSLFTSTLPEQTSQAMV